jgi:hypothetical protein
MTTPFVGPSYTLALRKADVQRSVNLHLVGMESPGKAPFVLQSVPGYTLYATGIPAVRGCITTNDRCFFVHGDGLYELIAGGGLTLMGTLSTSEGPVSMAYGTTQLVLVDGANGYIFTLSTDAFTAIVSDAWYGSSTVTFLDNYFLFVRPDTGQFYWSAINDATTLDALDFSTAESQPDNLVAIVTCQRRALMMGTKSTEIWSSSSEPAFEREGTTLEVGCMAAHSVRVVDNTAFWLGGDRNGGGIVYRLNGYQAQRISTQGVEQALQGSTDLSLATSYAYQENGLTFYALNAPGLTSTWVYEVSSGAWHERCDIDGFGQYKADRAVCHAYAFGYHLLGCDDGTIVRLDSSVHTKAGDPLVLERCSPHAVVPGLPWIFFDAFHLDCTTGDAPQGVDPYVGLSYSDDSGASWSNTVWQSSGKVGERFARVTWRRLGRSRDRVWKLKFAANARFDILNVQVDSRAGTS